MKKRLALLLALAFYVSILPPLSSAAVIKGNFSDIITKGPWVDVRAYGAALTDVPIQAAFDAHPTGNATIYIPAGNYTIGTELLWNGVDNITIRGDGIGRTILDASALADIPKRSGLGYNRTWGVLSINPMNMDTGLDDYHYNVTLENMTIIGSASAPVSPVYQKLVVWSTTNNVTFRNVEFVGAYYEQVYGAVSTGKTMKDQTVENCIFRNNVTGGMFNINTGAVVDSVRIINNVFDNGAIGINALHRGAKIRGNHFINMHGQVVMLGDGTTTTTKIFDGYDVTGNYFKGLGTGASSGATVYGINLTSGSVIPTDNSMAGGNIVSSNSFIDSVSPAGGGQVIGINVFGNALVSNNIFSGISTAGSGTADTAIRINYANASDTFQRVMLSGNVVEDTPTSKAGGKGWNFGISATGNDNAVYHLSGNKVGGINTGWYAFYMGAFPSQPIVTFNGDIFNGQIGTNTALNSMNLNDSSFNNMPIYGDLVHGLRTSISDDIRPAGYSQFTDNATTPSVAGGKIWYTNNTGATSITNFTGGVNGQIITLFFIDANTTIVHGATIGLDNSANFVATPDDTLTLGYLWKSGGLKWYELSRSVN